jgi:hypothetical protein
MPMSTSTLADDNLARVVRAISEQETEAKAKAMIEGALNAPVTLRTPCGACPGSSTLAGPGEPASHGLRCHA